MRLASLFLPRSTASAHCDLPCGVYDPAQARIEAESVLGSQKKYQDSDDPVFKERAVQTIDERAELVKHHLWVLWTDYFKPNHLEEHPNLHDLFWKATKQAGAGGVKGSTDPKTAEELLDYISEIDDIFWKTKGGRPQQAAAA